MRKVRITLASALMLAIVASTGLWAAPNWPAPTEPTTNAKMLCFNQTKGFCGTSWDTSCHKRGEPDYTDNWFTCGGTVYDYLQAQTNSWGLCQTPNPATTLSCTSYNEYPCIYVEIFATYCNPPNHQCDYYLNVSNICKPSVD